MTSLDEATLSFKPRKNLLWIRVITSQEFHFRLNANLPQLSKQTMCYWKNWKLELTDNMKNLLGNPLQLEIGVNIFTINEYPFSAEFTNHFRVWSCLEKWVEFWAPKNLQNPCQIFNRTSALKSKSHFSEKSIFLFFVYFLFIFSQVTRKTKPEIKRELQD